MWSTRQNRSSRQHLRERRSYPRRQVQSLAYVSFGATRGIVSDISESGLGVNAAASEIEARVSTVALQLPGSQARVETNGQIAWVSESKRKVGIRFMDRTAVARGDIHEWIKLESSSVSFPDKSRVIRPQPHAPASNYHVNEVRCDADLDKFLRMSAEGHLRFPCHTLRGDPEWIAQRFNNDRENTRIFLLQKGDEIVGGVAFVLTSERLPCELGEYYVAKFPMRVLRLQGHIPNTLEEEAAYDALFRQILESDFDAIYMENVKTKSVLWNYLRSSTLIRGGLRFYTKRGALPHPLIRLEGTFESYMKRLSPKTRKNRLREIKMLQKRCQVTLVRVTQASEIDAFLEAAYEISRRTWQFKRFGWGLASRDVHTVTRELRFLAERGWLRSYLLQCDGVACAFILAHQYNSNFDPEYVGVDDVWRKYSVGTVVMMLVLEDLFESNSPEFYDFGTPATHLRFQEYLATASYPEARVWLFRRQAYSFLASSVYRACNAISMNGGTLLERLGLKSRVKRLLWNHARQLDQ